MYENHPMDTARIKALKTSLVSLLEREREQGVPVTKMLQGASLLIEACQEVLNRGSKQLLVESFIDFGSTLQAVEQTYSDWRELDRAFSETLSLAYSGAIERRNLLVDVVHSDLRQRIGEPVAALYSRLHTTWNEHVGNFPWDAYLVPNARNLDQDELHANLQSLVHGDHLDVEDAVEELTGPLRYAFANHIETDRESLDALEESLWMRPEIIIVNDYWRPNSQVRILDVIKRNAGRLGSFGKVQGLFTDAAAAGGTTTPDAVVGELKGVGEDERETYLRCLMLHPDQQIRRYAVNNVDIDALWKVVTPLAVPCATILSMLEKVVGSNNYDENFQKVFFQTISRRLLALTSRTDVLYARGIIRILTQLPFFMEDQYFETLLVLIDYLSAKEKFYQITDGFLDEYIGRLKKEKDKIGTLRAPSANLTSIPPVVLRKLARDGHFWFELSMHPMFKIARETIPHINSQDRALRIANNHVVNQDVLREVGKKRSLFSSLPAKVALLSNPRTPPSVSLTYLMDLTRTDAETLLRRSTIHPELRPHLRNRLG